MKRARDEAPPLMQWRLMVARFDRGRRKKAQTIGLRRFDACRAVDRCRKFAGQVGEASGFARNNRDVLDCAAALRPAGSCAG